MERSRDKQTELELRSPMERSGDKQTELDYALQWTVVFWSRSRQPKKERTQETKIKPTFVIPEAESISSS